MATDNRAPIISPATPADIPAVLDFIRKLAEFEHLSYEMKATEADLHRHLFGPSPAAEVVMAKLDANPVGFALYFTTFSTFVGRPGIWLEDLFVLNEFRHRGIGRALLRHIAAVAVERNCGRLEWSVLDWNEPAIQLYRKLGAVAMSDWTTQRVTGDALLRLATES
ncbi:MAG TPA: GNAT family N-acetyltransferase [Tepidisphaeraceae bacterium]|jgi:GNAT superfamily N-acetyltransferase|nr:GNAT family N-acetyltransferase [Tepidisphaeraceae bacterium]